MDKPTGGRLRVAIYDTPPVMRTRLCAALRKSGYDVLYAGDLTEQTAATKADVWITKWSFNLKGSFLSERHPKKGILTLSVGTDHIDKKALAALDLRLETCPTFCSTSVAEHAVALAMRALYGPSVLPRLKSGQLIFGNFSDRYAEDTIAQMVMRARDMEASMRRAERFDYERHSKPWKNQELTGARVGIIGYESDASELAKILKFGFNCELFGHDTADELEAYAVRPLPLLQLIDTCDYLFLCTDRRGMIDAKKFFDTTRLETPEMTMSDAQVAVLGTGRIGSIVARIARLGFGCDVTAYSTTEREGLTAIGVRYAPSLQAALSDANIIFITLPFTDETKGLIGRKELGSVKANRKRVLVNVARDEIVDSEAIYDYLCRGGLMGYATDVLPKDKILWRKEEPGQKKEPDEMTRKFVQHKGVVATTHEGDCSRNSLNRLLREVVEKLDMFMGGL